jgi:hypothetical protein
VDLHRGCSSVPVRVNRTNRVPSNLGYTAVTKWFEFRNPTSPMPQVFGGPSKFSARSRLGQDQLVRCERLASAFMTQ